MPALLAIQIAMPVLGAMMLVMVWSLRRCDVPGVRQWWQGNVAVAMSLLLFGLRGHASDLLSVITANLLLLWGSAQFYAGLLRFSGRRPDWRRLWWAIAAVTAGVVAWRYGRDDFNLRVACVSALQAALSLHAGIVLLRRDREAVGQRHAASRYATAACALFFGTVYLLRSLLSAQAALAALADGAPGDSLAPAGLHIGFLLLGPLAMPAMTLCTVVMIHDRLVRRLEDAANTDFLTGTLSRQAFESEAARQFAAARRQGLSLTLLIVDIDHFKHVNDRFGHHAGDVVLQRFARLARTQTRPADRLGRLGGEEFAILLPELGGNAARRIAERIRVLAAADRVDGDFGTVGYTLSAGLATLRPGEGLAELAARADAALYQAKQHGRNRVRAAEDTVDATQLLARAAVAGAA